MDSPILGSLLYFGGNFNPYQWQLCNGQILPISSNTALFSLLGTYYGGNGTSTFGLPNLQGRRLIGAGNSAYGQFVLGEEAGVEHQTLTLSNLAAHNHVGSVRVHANSDGADSPSPQNNYPSLPDNGSCYQTTPTAGSTMAGSPVTLSTAGSNIPFSILNPFLAITVCICQYGVFPSRP